MDDGILVEIFFMLNVKALKLKGMDYVSMLDLPKENFQLNDIKSEKFGHIVWEGQTLRGSV